MEAIGMFLFWTFSPRRISRLIAAASDGWASHMGVGFEMDTLAHCYYESLIKKGWTGPRPITDLYTWARTTPGARLVIARLPVSAEVAETKRRSCRANVGIVGYPKWQMAAMLLGERYHLPVPHSPGRWVCSEAAARVVYPEVDLRDARRQGFDEVNPNSAWRRWCEIRAGLDFSGPATKSGKIISDL